MPEIPAPSTHTFRRIWPDARDYLRSELEEMPRRSRIVLHLGPQARLHLVRTTSEAPLQEWAVLSGQTLSSEAVKALSSTADQ